MGAWQLKRIKELQEKYAKEDMQELYSEEHTDDIDGRPKSNDRKTENGVNSFSSGRQIDEHISSAIEDSTVKLESSSASGDSTVKLKDSVETNQEAAVVHGGAVWDIFRRQDVPKLMEYLRKHEKEFRHIENHPVNSVTHPIHDQIFFLNEKHKKQLKREFGVEPWTFEPHLGEAVFIPAGCPHQVRNRQVIDLLMTSRIFGILANIICISHTFEEEK